MGMTTSLSAKWNMARGSWSRTLVSRTKVFRIGSWATWVSQMARALQLEFENEDLEVHDLRICRRWRGSARSLPRMWRSRHHVRALGRAAARHRAQSDSAARRARSDGARFQPRPLRRLTRDI